MKKRLNYIITLTLASLVLVSLNSCKKKDDDSDAQPTLSTVTVSGILRADLDATTNTTDAYGYTEERVAGVTVVVRVNAYDQLTNPSNYVNYPDKVYTGVTDANGVYSIQVEVGKKAGMYAEIMFPDFTYDYVTGGSPATLRTDYYGDNWGLYLSEGSNVMQNYWY